MYFVERDALVQYSALKITFQLKCTSPIPPNISNVKYFAYSICQYSHNIKLSKPIRTFNSHQTSR